MPLHRLFLPALLLALAPGPARATTVLRLPVEAMAERSDLVLRAEVSRVAVAAAPADERRITTSVTLRVLQVLKGHAAAPTLTIRLLGGSIGRWTLAVPGTPSFREGEEVVVFLEATRDGFKPAGLWLGKYQVRRDAAGGARAVRAPGDAAVVDEIGGAFALEGGVSHADDEIDLDALVSRIRAGAARGGAR